MVNWSRQFQPAQLVIVSVDRLYLLGWGLVERWKKSSFFSNSLAFLVEGYAFLIEVWSRIGWGLKVTCHTFIAQWLTNRSTPSSTGGDCFLTFWLSRLETYKLRVPLHLWVKDHLHLFVYLLVLASKALILSLVH